MRQKVRPLLTCKQLKYACNKRQTIHYKHEIVVLVYTFVVVVVEMLNIEILLGL